MTVPVYRRRQARKPKIRDIAFDHVLTMDMSAINYAGVELAHPRGEAAIVKDANLQVAPGEVVLVVAAAGLGTSRFVASTMGEVLPLTGKIELLGRDVTKLRRSSLRLLRRRVGIVPQDLCLLEDRSAQLNVVLPLEIDGVPRSVSVLRAAEVLAELELEDEAALPVDCLGTSARQRVAVARALVRTPDVLLMDHPTSAQDAAGAELVVKALLAAASRGAACLVFARDPQLRELAEHHGWRQLALVNQAIAPLGEVELDGRSIDDVLVGIESVRTPVVTVPSGGIPDNVVPFPITARTAGAR